MCTEANCNEDPSYDKRFFWLSPVTEVVGRLANSNAHIEVADCEDPKNDSVEKSVSCNHRNRTRPKKQNNDNQGN